MKVHHDLLIVEGIVDVWGCFEGNMSTQSTQPRNESDGVRCAVLCRE